jgi:hypothetical protein
MTSFNLVTADWIDGDGDLRLSPWEAVRDVT